MKATELYWLPLPEDWRSQVLRLGSTPGSAWAETVALANTRLDFLRTNALADRVRKIFSDNPPAEAMGRERLAVLGSSTLSHLFGGIRVGAIRRGLWVTIYEGAYGQYLQELNDQGSPLHEFAPTTVLFSFDAQHFTRGFQAAMSAEEADTMLGEAQARIRRCWTLARDAFRCTVLQQTFLNTAPPLLGNNEHRLPGSRHEAIVRLNAALREMAANEGVTLVSLDRRLAQDGLAAWHDTALWHRTKQEIVPSAAPLYGDLIGRVLAAKLGRSAKCLVLDLDNTLWGGVIGDDGLGGIVLGQGSGDGEGFVALQDYVADLSRRGVILAVVSKNDEANALEAFEKHPEMILRRNHIASFQANWNDKATNIREVAKQVNIGLDALVFLDDNPVERALIRQELSMVAVPEFPDEAALVPQMLADAGYFEATVVTKDDRGRTEQLQNNLAREAALGAATDMDSYLQNLQMRLFWGGITALNLQRTVQLINKTNQFNLTTRRYTEAEVVEVADNPRVFGLVLRLVDRFGDNGIISIIVGRLENTDTVVLDTWLMSCRVLGRQVERAALDLVVRRSAALGGRSIVGRYAPSSKNGMVRDHYERLGFTPIGDDGAGGRLFTLELASYKAGDTFIEVIEERTG